MGPDRRRVSMMRVNKNPEYFLTIAAEGSISKAAEKLYVSQPYLSQYIIRLEDGFGVKLLDREKTPLELTPAGRIYASYLESTLQMYQKLLQDFDAINIRQAQTLRLGFSNWRASTLLPDILPLFVEQHPDVRLEFLEVPNSDLYRLASEDKVDFVMMNTSLNIPDYLTSETILYEHILLVGNRNDPVTKKLQQMQELGQELDLHLLEGERVISLRPESALAGRVNNYLDKNQVVLRNVVYTDNAATALNLTAQNFGFCFLNGTGVSSAPNSQELVFFDLNSDDMVYPLCVVYKKQSYLRPMARAFINLTIEFYKRQFSEEEKFV